jgi:signal transduction histidine kinase
VRPLDRIPSLKLKLGAVIVGTVVGTVGVIVLGNRLDLPLSIRVIAATVIGLVMVQFLARGMTSPLREMAVATRAMAAGDYERRVTATSRDEVGELARAFNAMASDLADVERQRRDLVANVSHELRTPIGALQALLENLADGVEPAEPRAIGAALAQTRRLAKLVNQLLDLSRWEADAIVLERRSFEVEDLLDQAARECAAGADEEGRVDVDVTPAGLALSADRERLHQVLTNLIDNAMLHSPPGERVLLSAGSAAGQVRVVVEDQGPGIPADELERVFERFYRADNARASNTGGAGLGLAISRRIVEAHGGTIHAEAGEPHGCRMVMELPA